MIKSMVLNISAFELAWQFSYLFLEEESVLFTFVYTGYCGENAKTKCTIYLFI
jgi:hypothetical protein